MNIVKFTLADGSTDCYVNLDAVIAAKPSEDGKRINIHTAGMSLSVDREQFEKAVAPKGNPGADICSAVSRLIQAMDRMTVHFPTSIRMHL